MRVLARVRRFTIVPLCALAVALALGACGQQSHPESANANNNGFYVWAGPITYQLQISRELNPYSIEDRGYLAGVPVIQSTLTPTQEWFAVFLWAKNQTKVPATTSDSFDIIDTQGNRYYPIRINPAINPYAWTAATLQPNQTYPLVGGTAYWGPTQGGLILFKINTTAYNNRPLTLEIFAKGQATPSTISLDL